MPVRQWVLSFPIPLRVLLAAQPQLLTPVLQVVHRVLTRFLLSQAGLRADEADGGAVTLIQRFGSAANLNIHLHCLVLDGVYRRSQAGPVCKIIVHMMKMLTRPGALVLHRALPRPPRPGSRPAARQTVHAGWCA